MTTRVRLDQLCEIMDEVMRAFLKAVINVNIGKLKLNDVDNMLKDEVKTRTCAVVERSSCYRTVNVDIVKTVEKLGDAEEKWNYTVTAVYRDVEHGRDMKFIFTIDMYVDVHRSEIRELGDFECVLEIS